MPTQIWVDDDACPKVIKDILFRAAEPAGILLTLIMRDFMDTLRGSGIDTGGPAPLGPIDRQAFANALDRWLTRRPGGSG